MASTPSPALMLSCRSRGDVAGSKGSTALLLPKGLPRKTLLVRAAPVLLKRWLQAAGGRANTLRGTTHHAAPSHRDGTLASKGGVDRDCQVWASPHDGVKKVGAQVMGIRCNTSVSVTKQRHSSKMWRELTKWCPPPKPAAANEAKDANFHQ